MVTNPYMFPWDTSFDNITIETTPHGTTWSSEVRMTVPREPHGDLVERSALDRSISDSMKRALERVYRYSISPDHIKSGVRTERTSYQVPEKVIYNDPATVAFWSDGSKTVVKAHEDDHYDERFGLLMALLRKARDNKRYDQYEFLVKSAACMLDEPDDMEAFAKALLGMAAQVRKEEKDG